MSILGTIGNTIGLGSGVDSYSMIINFESSIGPLLMLLSATAYAIAICVMYSGIHHLIQSAHGQHGDKTVGKAIFILATSVMLVYLPSTIDSVSLTVFQDSSNPFSYTPNVNATDKVNQAMGVIYKFIGLIGFMATIKGILTLKRTAEGRQDNSIGKGLTYLVGGVIAIHMDKFVAILKNTFI